MGPVKFELIRYHCRQELDFDNLVSTGKIPTDCLVLAGVIIDDKPAIIQEREYRQVKVKRLEDQKTVILIEDIL